MTPLEREIRSRGVYCGLWPFRGNFQVVCPKGTHHRSLRLLALPELGSKLSTVKVRLHFANGQCYERTTRRAHCHPVKCVIIFARQHVARGFATPKICGYSWVLVIFATGPRSHFRQSRAAMTKKRQGRENRRAPRVEVSRGIWVAWRTEGSPSVSRVRDLSVGGVFVSTTPPPPNGTPVHLLFSLPEGEVRIDGSVRYSQEGVGMGVEFTQMGAADRARLQELIRRLNS
jgi:hypothetical protein